MKISTLTPDAVRGEGQIGFRALDGVREQRSIDYSLLKGRHYMARTSGLFTRTDRQPVNMTQQLIRTLTPFVAMNAPLADVTPLKAELEFEAEVRKQVHDRAAQRLKLHEVYQDAATEAFMSGVAFMLNGIKSGGETFTAGNRRTKVGQEFCRLLDLDDITIDPMCKNLDAARFFGYRYTIDRQDALDAIGEGCYGALPEDYEDGLLPNPYIASPEEAAQIISEASTIENAPRRAFRVDDNDGENAAGGTRLAETIVLWDMLFYMHGETWVVTLPGEPGQGDVFGSSRIDKFLACYRWRGPAAGPVTRMTFLRVPFNKMPLALAQMQRDLAEICDLLANKTFRQLIRTKNVIVYDGSAENMAMAMKRSPEGGYIRGNPNSVKTVQDGGLIPDMMPGTQYFNDQWQNAVGNLALAAGTGDTAKTATAFEGLMARIQSFLDFLRTRVEQAATDNLQIQDWFLSNNPAFQATVHKIIGSPPNAITAEIAVAAPGMEQMGMPGMPGMEPDYVMRGESEDFDIKTRAFSMQYSSPAVSAQMVMQAMTDIVPLVVQMSAGGGIDGRLAMGILARKLNEPALEFLVPDPMMHALQQQEQAMQPGLDQDPSGMGVQPYQQEQPGPAGRRVPGQQRQQNRAMRPGPGQGSPRPMQTPQPSGA